MAPPLDVWNKFLERRFPVLQAGSTKVSLLLSPLLLRTVADQVFFAPLGIAAFIGIVSVLEGRSRSEIGTKYRNVKFLFFARDLKNTGWLLWVGSGIIDD